MVTKAEFNFALDQVCRGFGDHTVGVQTVRSGVAALKAEIRRLQGEFDKAEQTVQTLHQDIIRIAAERDEAREALEELRYASTDKAERMADAVLDKAKKGTGHA